MVGSAITNFHSDGEFVFVARHGLCGSKKL